MYVYIYPVNYIPVLLYFSQVVAVAGWYNNAHLPYYFLHLYKIKWNLDAWSETRLKIFLFLAKINLLRSTKAFDI